MAVESVCSYISTAVGGFPISRLIDAIDRVWTIWSFILGVKQWLITQSLLMMLKILRRIKCQHISCEILQIFCKRSPQTVSNWWCKKSLVWTPRRYRWTKALTLSRDEPISAILLWLYSFWCYSSFLVNTDGRRRWIHPETNLQWDMK